MSKSVKHKKAWIALSIVVALALLGTLVAGFAAPARDSVPSDITLPTPMVGDQGRFIAIDATGQERPLADFEWLDDRQVRDRAGNLRWVNVLHYTDYEASALGESYNVLYDTADGAILAYEFEGVWEAMGETHMPTRDPPRTTGTGHRVLYASDDAEAKPSVLCGIRNGLQGAPGASHPSGFFGAGCELFGAVLPSSLGYRAVGRGLAAGMSGYLLQVDDIGEDVGRAEVWVSPSLAYPLRIGRETPQDAVPITIRLDAFAPGDKPIRQGDLPLVAGPRLEWAPALPWGPDDAAVGHEFPLSEAYVWMRDESTDREVRDWMATHPGAFVFSARYDETIDPDDTHRVWDVALTDGSGIMRRCPDYHTWHPARLVLHTGTSADDQAVEETVYEYPCDFTSPFIGEALPSRPPSTLPTLGSVEDLWRSVASEAFSARALNFWKYEVFCLTWTCDEPEFRLAAGFVRYEGQVYAEDPVTVQSTFELSIVTIDSQGRILSLDEQVQDGQRGVGTPVPDGQDASRPVPASIPDAASGLSALPWEFPPSVVLAGLGLFALAAGFAYWLWPSIQTAFVGGFTRLHRDELADHPIRSSMIDLIQASPGIHFLQVRRRLGLANGTARHHLDKLVSLGLVSAVNSQRYTCYFPRGRIDFNVMATAPALKSARARAILNAIHQNPGISGTQLAERTSINTRMVSYHVHRLRSMGLVTVEHVGREISLKATPVAVTAIAQMDVI